MNAPLSPAARPLLEIAGARWRVGVAAAAVAWDQTTGLAGFALADGTLALAHPVWDGAATLRPRPNGGVELVPGTAPAPPAARAQAHQGACLAVAANPEGGFLTGGGDGMVNRVQVDGSVRTIARFDAAVSLLVAGAGGWRACAVRGSVHRLDGTAKTLDLASPVKALALDPRGSRLAVASDAAVTLWTGRDAPRSLDTAGTCAHLAWNSTGTALVGAGPDHTLPDHTLRAWQLPEGAAFDLPARAPVAALSAFRAGFAAGAGGRVLCWNPPEQQFEPCGVANQSPVTRLAAHRRRLAIAAGYANGTVVLCQPNSAALLLVRSPGQGAVTALAFSRSGECLAIGTDGGEIGLVALPDALFRKQVSRQ